jgi:hypothetical protein
VWLFGALCVACVMLPVIYLVGFTGHRDTNTAPALPRATAVVPTSGGGESSYPTAASGPVAAEPHDAITHEAAADHHAAAETGEGAAATTASTLSPSFLLRHTGMDASYGALAADTGTGLADARTASALHCERAHFAAGRGVCLEARRGAITLYTAVLFDATFREVARLPLPGIPSRTRVSPDGRYASFTVFVFGHSYASTEFSTETRIFDAATGESVVANLEQMEVWKDGARIETPADVNFWGVTFADDSNRFYATMGTGGSTYLVAGDIAARRVRVVTDGVECPSLSPDNTRIAYKKRVPGSGLPAWRIHVMNLTTLADNAVAEPRFIDEQVEWLDNAHVLYTQQAADANSAAVTDIWSVPSDGTGAPVLLLPHAASPVAIRATKSAVLARAGAERP